jgi:CHAT domain-containing protein
MTRLVLAGLLALAAPAAASAQPVPLEEDRQILLRQAMALSEKGRQCVARRQAAAAGKHYQEALAVCRRLFPRDRYPHGQPLLIKVLSGLGGALFLQEDYGRAAEAFREALPLLRHQYPAARFPQGHADLQYTVTLLGNALFLRGQYVEAEPLCCEAVAMGRILYPAEKYPGGNPWLALGLRNLGRVLHGLEKDEEAEPVLREALTMSRGSPADEGKEKLAAREGELLRTLGEIVSARGRPAEAVALLRQALDIYRQAYPESRHPDGHWTVAACLLPLGSALRQQGVYAEAEACCLKALAIRRRLFPGDNADVAACLGILANVVEARGDLGRAEEYQRESLAMLRRLAGPEPSVPLRLQLADALHRQGALLARQRDHARAEALLREAVARYRSAYPVERYPDGHRRLAGALSHLGAACCAQGHYRKAEENHCEALAMYRKLYPGGHPDVVGSLLDLAEVTDDSRDGSARAERLFREALALADKLALERKHARAPAALASAHHGLSVFLMRQERHAEGARHVARAVAAYRLLYPPEQCPVGHPSLLRGLLNLGAARLALGDYAAAEQCYREGLAMQHRLFSSFADQAAEAQALSFLGEEPYGGYGLLSASSQTGTLAGDIYACLWPTRAAVARLLQERRQALAQKADPETRRLAEHLRATRRQLATLLLAPAEEPGHAERLRQLSAAKEDLERRLTARLPRAQRERDRQGPADLTDRLPAGAAVIDLVLYHHFGKRGEGASDWHYTAFVLQKGRPIRRVELGPAEPIDVAAMRWRAALVAGKGDATAAGEVRRRLWLPLAKTLAPATTTVYLVPDGRLVLLPWAALPGSKPGTVLVEEMTLAVLPFAPFLLGEPAGARAGARGGLLVVGGVAYEEAPAASRAGRPPHTPLAAAKRVYWPALPATAVERDRIMQLAADAGLRDAAALAGRDAGTDRVLAALARARWAHLATHGFFAGPAFGAALRLDAKEFTPRWLGGRTQRLRAGARNPLALSGLVLAGANLPVKDPEKEDGGILTAEAIAGLNLDNLELAVLSACETGLGEVAGGEGVFGLQRAFHLAGAKNVVASLWKVDDEATAALMGLFYHKLWQENLPPLEALRQAQLTLYRHPERIANLARQRGPEFEKTARLPAKSPESTPQAPAPARLWAAFVLSGLGR